MLALNFQKPFEADEALRNWFDVGLIRWAGNAAIQSRALSEAEITSVRKMIQKRHLLVHSGGIVDEEYMRLSSDGSVRLGERIRVRSSEAKQFVECVAVMAQNLLDGAEYGFGEARTS